MNEELFVEQSERFVVRETNSFLFQLVSLWNKTMPRGKGSVPRFFGALLTESTVYRLFTSRGATLFFTRDSLDMGAHFFNSGGHWNESVIRACIASTSEKKNPVFYDIGANLGVVSIELSTALLGQLQCFAFEPQKHLCEALTMSATANGLGNIKVINSAVGNSTGALALYTAASSIHVSHMARNEKSQSFEVNCYSLDDLVGRRLLPPPTVIKIDVEGGEFDVFCGARETISNFSPTIIFESDENMTRWGYGREEILRLLSEYAPYKFYVLLSDGTARIHRSDDSSRPFDMVATLDDDFPSRYKPA